MLLNAGWKICSSETYLSINPLALSQQQQQPDPMYTELSPVYEEIEFLTIVPRQEIEDGTRPAQVPLRELGVEHGESRTDEEHDYVDDCFGPESVTLDECIDHGYLTVIDQCIDHSYLTVIA